MYNFIESLAMLLRQFMAGSLMRFGQTPHDAFLVDHRTENSNR